MAMVCLTRRTSPLGITDDFNRADGTSVLLNRSDGGLWTPGVNSDHQILTNRLIRTADGITANPQWLWADYGYASTVSASVDFSFGSPLQPLSVYIAAQYTAGATSSVSNYEVKIVPNIPNMEVNRYTNNGLTQAQLAVVSTPSWANNTARRMTITLNYATRALTVSVAGTTYVSITVPAPVLTNTGFALLSSRSYATNGSYWDNVAVTGT